MTASGSDGRVARHIHIKGKVQGVWFRARTVEQAQALGLDGWVRNRIDGSVEAVAAGQADAVDELIARCHQGPSAARVDRVTAEDVPGEIPAGFIQRATI